MSDTPHVDEQASAETVGVEVPVSTEISSTEVPTSTEVPVSAEVARAEVPASTETSSTEVPVGVEVPASTETSSTEVPVSVEVPANTETSSTEVPVSVETVDVEVPVSIDTPIVDDVHKHPVSIGFRLLLSLANAVVWLAIIPFQQFLLPAQSEALDPANKISTLALLISVSGITGFIAQPLAGALSDRTSLRFGRRRSWIVVGMILSVLTLLLMANAQSVLVLALEAAFYGIAMAMILTPLLSIVPDRVPVSQRATVSAFVGLAQPIGVVAGSIIIAQILKSVQSSYYAIAGLLFIVISLFVFFVHEKPLPKEAVPAFSLKEFVFTFFSPLKSADFAYTWVARFLVILAQTMLVEFMLYYLKDVIHYDRLFPGQAAEQGVALFQVLNTVCLVISTIVSGIVSDKLQLRKPFIITASIIMTIALVMMALVQTWAMVLIVAVIFGIGFGVYLSTDIALATQVLPKAQNSGKDFGLITSANVLPGLLFPVISFLAFSVFHGYTALFLMAATATFLGALFIIPIKSVR